MTQREFMRRALRMMVEKAAPPEQLPLPFYGKTIDVDGVRDPKCIEITYWGKATCVFDNVYRCYADVGGNLCIVEVTVTALPRRSA